MSSLADKKILVTGGNGFVGKYVVRQLLARGASSKAIMVPRAKEFDLRTQKACKEVTTGKDFVLHLAATVGGIGFNQTHAAEAFYDNAVMAVHLIDAAYRSGVEKFVGIGSVCSYPKFAPVPFREEDLWKGYPEETNAAYGLAKKMMLVQSQAYREQYKFNAVHLLLVNLYGPDDNFAPKSSHVVSALIKKVYDAKKENSPFIEAWGTGRATREFLYVEDAAEGIVRALEHYEKAEPVNLGSGAEISIKNLLALIARIMDYKGEIQWDITKPDGQPRRMLDVTRAEREFGFKAKTNFEEGLKKKINWYLSERKKA